MFASCLFFAGVVEFLLYSSTARVAFGAGTDWDLKRGTNQRVDPGLAVSGSLEELENRKSLALARSAPFSPCPPPEPSAGGTHLGGSSLG